MKRTAGAKRVNAQRKQVRSKSRAKAQVRKVASMASRRKAVSQKRRGKRVAIRRAYKPRVIRRKSVAIRRYRSVAPRNRTVRRNIRKRGTHQLIEIAPGQYSIHLIGDVDGHPIEDLIEVEVANEEA